MQNPPQCSTQDSPPVAPAPSRRGGRLFFDLAAAAAMILTFGLCVTPLLTGRAGAIGDAESWSTPYFTLLSDFTRAGQFMLWDPWTETGVPVCAEPHSGAFSPAVMLAARLTGGTQRGFVRYWLATWLLGGLGMLVLARRLGASSWGGFVVGMGYLFSGVLMGHAEHISCLHSFVALPWIMWRFDVALQERRFLPAIEAGGLWGLSALSGYPSLVLSTAGLAALWAAGRAVCCSPDGQARHGWHSRLVHAVECVLILGAVGLLIASPMYVAFNRETPGVANRSMPIVRWIACEDNAFDPQGLGTLASPYLARLQLAGLADTYSDYSMLCVYVGALSLWLAVLAILLRPRDAWRWWILAIGLLGLGLAMGRALPLRGWLYDLCPITRYFRHAAMFRFCAVFALCTLAALGARDLAAAGLASAWRPRWRVLGAAIVLGLSCIAIGCRQAHCGKQPNPDWLWADLSVLAIWGSVMVLAVVCVWAMNRPTRWAAVPLLACLIAAGDAASNSQLVAPIYRHSVEPILREWQDRLHGRRRELHLTAAAGLQRDLNSGSNSCPQAHLVQKRAVVRGYTTLMNYSYLDWCKTPALVDAISPPARMWFSPTVLGAGISPEAFQAFRSRASELGAPPMVIHSREALLAGVLDPIADGPAIVALRQQPAATRLAIELIEYDPQTLAFRVTCPADGWLVATDRWAPGWRAVVNGADTPVLGGMFLFRAVRVKAGANEICFTYRPWGHPWFAMLSFATLGAVVAASLGHAAWRWRRGGSRHSPTAAKTVDK